MIPDLWDVALQFRVLVTFGLVLAGFVPLIYSVVKTWNASKRK